MNIITLRPRKRKPLLKLISILLTTVIITTCITTLLTTKKTTQHLYATTAVITEINHTSDYIVATNSTRTFIIYPSDDWHIGDHLSIVMNDNNTPEIIDDEIINYRYTSFTETEYNVWTLHTTNRK